MILRALWLRPTRRAPARFLATVLGVAIGVGSVVATLLASRASVASLREGVEEVAGRARLEIARTGDLDEDVMARLAPLCGDVLVAPVIDETAHCPALGDLVRVLGVDLLVDAQVRALELDGRSAPGSAGEGSLRALLVGNAAALPRALADELGLELGDQIELLVRSRHVALEVAALFEPQHFASVWERVLVVDVALAQELYGRPGRLDRIELVPRHEQDPDALAARVSAVLPPDHVVRDPSARRRQTERMLRSLEFNLTALSGISVLVAIVLVATTLATSVVQRRYPLALLRSLGASRRQLARAVLVEAGAIGLVGGLLGVALGALGGRAALSSVRATASTLVAESLPGAVRVEPVWIALGLVLGVGASLVASVLPLAEALRIPPLQALSGERPESVARRRRLARAGLAAAFLAAALGLTRLPPIGGRPLFALLAALCVLAALLALAPALVDLCAGSRSGRGVGRGAVAVRVAQAALEAGRRRAAWAAGAIGVAVGLAVAMSTMIGSFRRTVVDWAEQTMRSDLFVRPLPSASGVPAGRLDPAVVAAAVELFGAEAVDPFHTAEARCAGERVTLAGAALDVVAREGGVPFLDGRPSTEVFREALERRGAVVNEPFARRFDVARGDRVQLETRAGPIEREVVGVFRDYSNPEGLVVLARGDFLDLHPDDGPESLAIFLPAGRDPSAARGELLGALGGRFALEALPNREVRAQVLEVFERTFAVTVALQLVSCVVAAIAVVTVLFALVSERRRELALVRVLGGSRAQVMGIVVGEAGLLGGAGALGGLAAGLAVGWVLVRVVNLQSFGWTLRFLPPWGSIGWTVAAVLPACLLAGLLPAWRASRLVPQEVLREDG